MFEILGVILIILLVLYIPYILHTTKHGAPYVAMEPEIVEKVMSLGEVKKGDVFYELGSGDGRLVIAAALRDANSYGVEVDFLRVLYSRFWIKILRLKNAHIIHRNFFNVDLQDADVVCLYLLQSTNEKIQPKLEKELKKGTRVISVAFHFPNWQPVKFDPEGTIYGPIYVYRM